MREVIVIGGGAAGLRCALELCERGRDVPLRVTLLEAADRVGGRIGTVTQQQGNEVWHLERGPATLQEQAPGLMPLIDRLGLRGEVAFSGELAEKRYLLRHGKLLPAPSKPPQLLTSRVLPLLAKLRLLWEPLVKPLPPGPAGPAEETLGAFCRRRLGRETTEQVIDAVMGGIFAGDIDQLSVRSAMPRLWQMEQEHGSLLRGAMALMRQKRQEPPDPGGPEGRENPGDPAGEKPRHRLLSFRQGMGTLTAALAQALSGAGGQVLLSAPARELSRDGHRWCVRTDGAQLHCDQMVLALPPPQAQALLRPVDAQVADAYAGIPMVPVCAVSLSYLASEVPHPLDGFGFLVPRREGLRLLGVLFMTSALPDLVQAPPGHVLLRLMYGGARDPEIIRLSDAQLLAQAQKDLQATLHIRATPHFSHIVRWEQAIEQYVLGHAARVETIEGRLSALGMVATGAALHGISVTDVLRDGQAAAERLLQLWPRASSSSSR